MTNDAEAQIAATARQAAADVRREGEGQGTQERRPRRTGDLQKVTLAVAASACFLMTAGNLAGLNPYGPKVRELTPAQEAASHEAVVALGNEWVASAQSAEGGLPAEFAPGYELGPWRFAEGTGGTVALRLSDEALGVPR